MHAGFPTNILIYFVTYTTFHSYFWSNYLLLLFFYHGKNNLCLASVTIRTLEVYFAFLIPVLYLF